MQQTFRTAGVASTAGNLTLTFRGRAAGRISVKQVSCKMAAGASALAELQLDGAFVCPLLPTGDAATEPPAVDMEPGQELSVVWTRAPSGAAGEMFVIYDDGRRS